MRDPAARRILTVEPAGNGYRAGLEKSCPRDTDCVYPEKSTLILLPNAVSAASVNSEGRHPAYSSTGEHIWVSAPGGEYLGFNTPSIVTADLSGCERGLSAVRAYTRFLHLQGFSDPRRVAAGHGGCGAPDEPCAYICMSHDQRYQEENVLAPLVFACSAYVYRAAYGAVFYIIYLYKISR